MPSSVVVLGVNGVSDPTLDLNAKDERMKKFTAGHRACFSQWQQGRRDRPSRMDNRSEMGIIEIEDVRRDSVQQSRVEQIQFFAAAKNRCLPFAGKRTNGGKCAVEGRVDRAANRAAGPVQERACRLRVDMLGNVVGLGVNNEVRENLRDLRLVDNGGIHLCCSPETSKRM